MTTDEMHADVAVIGAGMGGLTVAATVAQAGLSVVVVEVSSDIGGSAALSEGYVWTAPSVDVFRKQDPLGDAERFQIMLDESQMVFEWLQSVGVHVGRPLAEVLGFGVGRQIDVHEYLQRCRRIVESSGGWVLLRTFPRFLLDREEGVSGVEVQDLNNDAVARIVAPNVVLATGGVQANADARAELLFPAARSLVLRSNTFSQGDGLRLAVEVGAELTAPTSGFYGRLVPYPMEQFEPKDYAALAQYHSEHGILLDKYGRRFTDESLGDHVNAGVVAPRGPVLLVTDERIRREHMMRPFIPGMSAFDKMAEAGRRGANYVVADSVAALAPMTLAWGYDHDGIEASISSFNSSVVKNAEMEPPRARHRRALTEPPFAALEVQAAITFTYRGLATDHDGRVLSNGSAIHGLFAAGVDAGGLNVWGFTGGLMRGVALGRRTGKAIVAS